MVSAGAAGYFYPARMAKCRRLTGGLFAGAAFYFTWLQVHMTARQCNAALYLILSSLGWR
ncbi:hypothetical protein sch_06885 [Serratia plymuthica]|jgi:hypothetical protein|nr:hypothetical protein sch_06885 [Serratia plymuthica]